MHKLAAIGIALLVAASQPVAAALGRREPACPGPTPPSNPKTASGVGYKVLLNGLTRPRGITIDSEGNLLVVEGRNKGVTRVVLNDAPELNVCVESSELLVDESTVRDTPSST
jgi:glucose/arabinose dehydrogenase